MNSSLVRLCLHLIFGREEVPEGIFFVFPTFDGFSQNVCGIYDGAESNFS